MAVIMLFSLGRWRVTGRENVPKHGPMLVVANHLSLADPPIVSVSLGRNAVFMAKEELFHSRFSGYFVGGFGAFPVRRGTLDRKALQLAEQWLGKGVAVVMFPEGKRSKTGRLQMAFSGSALIASRTGVPVLPVGITGTEKIGKGAWWWLRRPVLKVSIGQPFRLPAGSGQPSKDDLARQTDSIMEHIARLLPPEYGGIKVEEDKS